MNICLILGLVNQMKIPCEIRHVHHNHTHLFGQHDNFITLIVPFAHFCNQSIFLHSKSFIQFCNLCFFFGWKLLHNGLQEQTFCMKNLPIHNEMFLSNFYLNIRTNYTLSLKSSNIRNVAYI